MTHLFLVRRREAIRARKGPALGLAAVGHAAIVVGARSLPGIVDRNEAVGATDGVAVLGLHADIRGTTRRLWHFGLSLRVVEIVLKWCLGSRLFG